MIVVLEQNQSYTFNPADALDAIATRVERNGDERWQVTLTLPKPNGDTFRVKLPMKNKADADAVIAAVDAA